MIAHSLKALYTETASKLSRNSQKFGKLQEERPKWKVFLIKLPVSSTLPELDYTTYTFLQHPRDNFEITFGHNFLS